MENVDPFQSKKDPDSKNKFNKIYIGIILGVIGPVIGFWLFYWMQFSFTKSPSGYWEMFLSSREIQSKILSLSVIVNLAIFFIFLKFDFRSAALGVLYATFAYVPIVLYLKFF